MSKRSRRQFLKGMAATGGGAALAGVATSSRAVTPQSETEQEKKPASQGYRLTEHVRQYYDKARF